MPPPTFSNGLPALTADGIDLSILDGLGRNRPQGNGVDCSTPDPTAYHDPRTQFTSIEQRPLSSVMPSGRFGLNGVVVPRATWGGGSMGFNPHKLASNKVNVVDQIDARWSCEIDMAQVTAEMAADAIGVVEKACGQPAGVEEWQNKNAATFNVISQMARKANPGGSNVQFGNQQPRPAPQPVNGPAPVNGSYTAQPQAPQPVYQNGPAPVSGSLTAPPAQYQVHYDTGAAPPAMPSFQPNYTQPPPQPQYRQVDPMAAFAPQANGVQHARPPVQDSGMGPLPTFQVTFGTAIGAHEAAFHSVISLMNPDGKSGILVLGTDQSYRGPKFVPKAPAPGATEEMAIAIQGSPTTYKVEHMGIQFEHKGELLTQFLIVDSRTTV